MSTVGGKVYKYLEVAPVEQCRSMKHLDEIFQDIMARGGEGIILRDPSAFYQAGRSPGYLKHKVSYSLPPFAFYCLLALQLCIEIQGRRSQDCRSGGTTPMGM